jgi:ribonucleoside-diphosphate reductase alpha chain
MKIKTIKPKQPLVRQSHLFSIAPNASSSLILDTSPSIEPYRANVYLEKGVNGTKTHKNKYLEILLEEKGKNTPEVWSEIISNDGSVATLDFLTEWEKDVFKTAMEIDQAWLIQHAADRQPFICQAQSLNLFFDPTVSVEYLHLVHLMAWQMKLKSLYYCRSDSMRKADKVGKKVAREKIEDIKELAERLSAGESTCVACE